MKINPDQSGFELLPFLRSPGGCLVTVFCLLVGGCFCGLVWMKGFTTSATTASVQISQNTTTTLDLMSFPAYLTTIQIIPCYVPGSCRTVRKIQLSGLLLAVQSDSRGWSLECSAFRGWSLGTRET